MRRILMILLSTALLFASSAFGAAHGLFPGLSNLIGTSDAIVVASVESLPRAPRAHSGNSRAVQKVRILHVLKGNFTLQEQIDVKLDSEILYPSSTYLRADEYLVGERYVLFIESNSFSPGPYSTVNAEGSAFWIPSEADLSQLKPGDVGDNIASLLDDVLIFSRPNEQALMGCLEHYLSEEPERLARPARSCSGP